MKHAEFRPEAGRRVSAEQVRAYLEAHPDFFAGREDLLEILTVPHRSGAAVSLVERQLAIYRDKNKKLQQQLEHLLSIARENEQLLQKTHQLALALMDARSLESAVAGLQSQLYDHFKADFVSIRMIGNETHSVLAELFVPLDDPRLESFAVLMKTRRPECGQPSVRHATFFFGDNAVKVESCALVPFLAADRVGLLAIGSRCKDRFLPGMGHLFLSRIGEMIGNRLGSLLDGPE